MQQHSDILFPNSTFAENEHRYSHGSKGTNVVIKLHHCGAGCDKEAVVTQFLYVHLGWFEAVITTRSRWDRLLTSTTEKSLDV